MKTPMQIAGATREIRRLVLDATFGATGQPDSGAMDFTPMGLGRNVTDPVWVKTKEPVDAGTRQDALRRHAVATALDDILTDPV